jgi:hypothetical protein
VNNINIGEPDIAPDAAAHVAGVPQGNQLGGFERTHGLYHDGAMGKATAARSTGINPDRKGPITPKTPTLTPA